MQKNPFDRDPLLFHFLSAAIKETRERERRAQHVYHHNHNHDKKGPPPKSYTIIHFWEEKERLGFGALCWSLFLLRAFIHWDRSSWHLIAKHHNVAEKRRRARLDATTTDRIRRDARRYVSSFFVLSRWCLFLFYKKSRILFLFQRTKREKKKTLF